MTKDELVAALIMLGGEHEPGANAFCRDDYNFCYGTNRCVEFWVGFDPDQPTLAWLNGRELCGIFMTYEEALEKTIELLERNNDKR